LEKAWDSYQYRYSLYRDEVERRELPEKDKKKHAIERLLNVRVELKYFSGLFEEKHLLKMYIPLLEYPSLQQALKPYFTACFASPWSDGIPKASELIPKILEQVKYLRSMRVYFLKEEQKKHREYLQREFNIWLPKPSPSFSFFEKKRLNQSDYGPFFEINLLDSFKEFLNQYKDKAIMVLVLISSVFNPLYWVHFDNYPSGEDKWSPKYNMLYLPTLVNREPLEILLLLERIATILSGVNVETDCGKYYWLAEAGNPYYERKHNRKRLERYGFCMSEFESMLVMIPEVKGLFNRKLLEYRDDVQFLRKQLEQHPRQRALYALAQNQELVITYLQCRACDIVLYGEKLADRTFPQPTIKDATSKQVADMVTWMVTILQEFEQQKERKKEEEEKKWQAITIKELQQQFDEHFSNKIIPMPDTLPPRILSDNEREKLINICLNEFSRSGDGNIKVVLAVIDEFVKFCALLNKPENHIKVPSRQYVEKQVNTRAFADMTHEMSQKLAGLPRFSAWAKVLQEQKGEQTVLKRKMKTLPMPPLLDPSDKIFTMLLDYLMNPATYTGVVKKRSEIEEEIRQRQEKWRDRAPEEPPPTHSAKTSKEPPVSEEEKFPDKTAEKERKEENKQEKLASLTALKEALASIPSRKGKEKLPTATVTKPDHITLPAIKSIHGWSAPQVQELQKQTVQALNMKVDFRDNLKGGGQGPLMVVILAGRFQMGSPDTELGRKKDERQHEVEIAPFAMGKYPVTFEEYDRFTEVTRRKKPSDEGWGRGRRPVINVSWFDAVAFTGWLSEQTGQTYRLPTEAEWEYACRAGTTTPFYFGETISTDQANYNGNYAYGNGLKGILRGKTVEVGQFPANAWGLHDMHGNVYEWTDSVYDKRYEGGEQRCARLDRDGFSVLRGGSFLSNPQVVRCAARAPYVSDTRYYGYGFRVVVSPFFSGR
jgi:formylglycine-generating enzyme required for sulfatase activity